MYAYFKGTLQHIDIDSVILEVNNIGYNIFLSQSSIAFLPRLGEEVKIYTYTCVREDAFLLYGFLSSSDLDIFKKCITVNGIGPKGALAILSVMDADTLKFAILAGDAKALAKAPGIGAKTAQRLILELKDKVSVEDDFFGNGETSSTTRQALPDRRNVKEAVEALVALGYSSTDATKAVKDIESVDEMDVELILKLALKKMF